MDIRCLLFILDALKDMPLLNFILSVKRGSLQGNMNAFGLMDCLLTLGKI